MSHTMKSWEKVIDLRIKNEVTIAEQHFGFIPGRSTIDAIFCLRMLMEKWSEGQKAVHCVFIELEKAFKIRRIKKTFFSQKFLQQLKKYVNWCKNTWV